MYCSMSALTRKNKLKTFLGKGRNGREMKGKAINEISFLQAYTCNSKSEKKIHFYFMIFKKPLLCQVWLEMR